MLWFLARRYIWAPLHWALVTLGRLHLVFSHGKGTQTATPTETTPVQDALMHCLLVFSLVSKKDEGGDADVM